MKQIKKHYKLLIFLWICLLIFLIYQGNNKNNINYTSLGDSFALGEDSFGRIDYGYSDYVKDYLQKNHQLNRYIKSFSDPTLSIETLNQNIQLNKKIKLKKQVLNLKQTLRETTILTLSIGKNDLIYQLSISRKNDEQTINQIIKRIDNSLNQLIKEIKKYYPNQIYIIGYYHDPTKNQIYNQAIDKLNNCFQNKKDIIYIKTDKLFENNNLYRSNPNSIYPNQLGYQKIAGEIIKKLEKA